MTTPPRERLFTPGPGNTTGAVRAALAHDIGSRTEWTQGLTREVIDRLARVAGAGDEHAVVLLQGSGTFAIEAMLASCPGPGAKVLVARNGPYGDRMVAICAATGVAHATVDAPWLERVDPAAIDAHLAADPAISHVAVVHFETGVGVLNPLAAIADVCARHGRRLLVDAMSSFGAEAIDLAPSGPIDALAASSNKCLHGVPGIGIVVARRSTLEAACSPGSLVLDLAAQHRGLRDGQWRFTPPTQALLALRAALVEYERAGGRPARRAHYQALMDALTDGFAGLGIERLVPDAACAPMITTFALPAGAGLTASELTDRLAREGLRIYASVLAGAGTFRVGLIGALELADVRRLVDATAQALGAGARRAGARRA